MSILQTHLLVRENSAFVKAEQPMKASSSIIFHQSNWLNLSLLLHSTSCTYKINFYQYQLLKDEM